MTAADEPGPPGHGGLDGGHRFHPHAWISGDPEIGAGTWIGAFAVIDGSGGLRIGRGCDIGSGAHVYTHSSIKRCVSGRAHADVDRAPTTLGDRVFIGPNATVLMGVTIGDGAVVVAGSVVAHDVPAGRIVAGVPARVVGRADVDGDHVDVLIVDRDWARRV